MFFLQSMMMLKLILLLCLIYFASSTDIENVDDVSNDRVIAFRLNPLENDPLSQNSQEKDEAVYLYDSQKHVPAKQSITDNMSNKKQPTKKKKKTLNFCPGCFKFKSKENKAQTKDEPGKLNAKIKVKSTNDFDKIRNTHRNALEAMNKNPLEMYRKSSAPTHRVTIPIELSRRFSGESVKSAIILSRKPSGESVKSAMFIDRKSSAESVNSRTSSDEGVKPPTNLGKRYTQKWKSFLGNPISFINKPPTEKEQETPLEETSDPRDIRSYSCANVLLYVCLIEDVENCQKCKTLKHIFQSQNSEQNYLLYNLPIQKLQNPTELDFQNIPTWLELMLWSIVTEKQDMKLRITLNHENGGESNYQSKSKYTELLTKNARVSALGGHIFFSVLKSKFLTEDLNFFLENKILKAEDTFVKIGESEGVKVIDGEKYINTFLLDGVMEEDSIDYTPTVGNIVTSRNNLSSYYEDQDDPEEIVQGTLLTVEQIDPKDSWILVSYTDANEEKQQWISPEDFKYIIEQK